MRLLLLGIQHPRCPGWAAMKLYLQALQCPAPVSIASRTSLGLQHLGLKWHAQMYHELLVAVVLTLRRAASPEQCACMGLEGYWTRLPSI